MLNNFKFLTKDLKAAFAYSNFNEEKTCQLKKTIDGIEYTATVNFMPSAVAGFIFKVFDGKETKYVLLAGKSGGFGFESEEELFEAAKEMAMANPIMCISYDNMPDDDIVETMMLAYLETTEIEITQ